MAASEITRLLPVGSARTRILNAQRMLREIEAKQNRGGFLSTTEMARRTNLSSIISRYNSTGKVYA